MEGIVLHSSSRDSSSSFAQEKKYLLACSKVTDVQLRFLSLFEGEALIRKNPKGIGFLYFYDEDLYLEDLAVRLGVPTYSNPKNYLYGHDLGAFYRRISDSSLACPRFYIAPHLEGEGYSKGFEELSLGMKEEGLSYPLRLRRRSDADVYSPSLCLTPIEFNAKLKELGSSPFVCEEFLSGPLLLALVIGKKCFGILEQQGKEWTRSSSDNRFVRSLACQVSASCYKEASLVLLQREGKTPLPIGISSRLPILLFDSLLRTHAGEEWILHLQKLAKEQKVFLYSEEESIKRERALLSKDK